MSDDNKKFGDIRDYHNDPNRKPNKRCINKKLYINDENFNLDNLEFELNENLKLLKKCKKNDFIKDYVKLRKTLIKLFNRIIGYRYYIMNLKETWKVRNVEKHINMKRAGAKSSRVLFQKKKDE